MPLNGNRHYRVHILVDGRPELGWLEYFWLTTEFIDDKTEEGALRLSVDYALTKHRRRMKPEDQAVVVRVGAIERDDLECWTPVEVAA